MIKTLELRKSIQSFLTSKHSRVYFQAAPAKAKFPYVVYDLPNSTDDGSMERFILEVDGWDAPKNGDTTALETIMSNIDGNGNKLAPTGLHRRTVLIVEGELSATFYRENRLALDDDDDRIRRRQYVYQIRTHE